MGIIWLVLLVAAVAAMVTLAINGTARRLGPGSSIGAIGPAAHGFRNHQHMARWIERQLNDDMVRVVITEEDQELARALLAEFYDDRRS